MNVNYHPEVMADLSGAYNYYRDIHPELGTGFIEEYRNALAFVKSDPLVMRTFYNNDRRVMLKRFKSFAVIYEVLENEILIKAVADLRRKPYFWENR